MGKQFTIQTAVGGKAGLAAIQASGPFAVVVADMQMPEMNGTEFLAKVEALAPDTIRLMLTGNPDQRTAADAVNKGHVFRFLSKPCPQAELTRTLKEAPTHYGWLTGERELLEKTLAGSVKLLNDVLSLNDPTTFGQAQRLREYMHSYVVSLNNGHNWEFEIGAMLSQIGASSFHVKPTTSEALIHQVLVLHANWMTCEVPEVDSTGRQVMTKSSGRLGERFPQVGEKGGSQRSSGIHRIRPKNE